MFLRVIDEHILDYSPRLSVTVIVECPAVLIRADPKTALSAHACSRFGMHAPGPCWLKGLGSFISAQIRALGRLVGHIFIHNSDESGFVAEPT
jgi:hypothetical protein